ncbi:TetR/AcrR family transcriptional regulator [Saccharothrix coeruleofusca]|uniref:TetR/AcrR family transcriptional regulator n=1 Tax=Saccharothrix coeruleofusca TaxID=33919 RepID=UPI001E3CD2F2|nr:TetR/AcrR family transcriptional regulator [Saccharothrix coeruleofusca]
MNSDTSSSRPGSRQEQAEATRALLLRTAERLYAERGLAQVSNRQIVEAAGQANNSALTYHFGTRADVIRAIALAHAEPIGRRLRRRVEATRGSADPREHIACLVLPHTEHLAELGVPSWYARFAAQVATDPALDSGVRADPLLVPYVEESLAAVWALAPDLSPAEVALRTQAARLAIIHTCAQQERVAAGTGVPADWAFVGEALTDAVTGLLLAPRLR